MDSKLFLMIVGLLLFTCILISAAFIVTCLYLKRSIDSDISIKRDMFLFSLPINDEENFNILDKIIAREISIYQVYNFDLHSKKLYIGEEDQKNMVKNVLREVLRKISPVYMNKLIYIYNKDALNDIIYEKVRDSVLNFSIEINGTFRDEKKNNQVV